MPLENQKSITILHISDIHRTTDEPVTNRNILEALTADLKRQQEEEGLPKPDFLVISGDLTQAASEEEYDDAYKLIDQLKNELRIPDFSRVILVPGNHDVNWGISETLFSVGRRVPSGIDDALIYNCNDLYCWTDERTYAQRLELFRAFYHRIYHQRYGTFRREQYDIWSYPELDVCFVGLSSCDLVDHLRFRGTIYEEALFVAEQQLRDEMTADLTHCIKIAVWHHDLNWLGRPGHEDGLDPSILGHLVDAGYDLALCGHTHRTRFNTYTYSDEFRLPIVAAGSLCAGARQREESIPRLYNLIHIKENKARVHTRFRETKHRPWGPYARWGRPACSYFDIPLVRRLSPIDERHFPDELHLGHTAEQTSLIHEMGPLYYVRIYLDTDEQDLLGEISKVVYNLHESFPYPVREVTNARNKFELGIEAWGEFTVYADVYFKNDNMMQLTRYLSF